MKKDIVGLGEIDKPEGKSLAGSTAWHAGEAVKSAVSASASFYSAMVSSAAGVVIAGVIAAGGFGQAMSHANTDFANTKRISQNFAAVGEVFRAPWIDAKKANATLDIQREVADKFYHGKTAVVPEDMVPDTHFAYRYAGPSELNANAGKVPDWMSDIGRGGPAGAARAGSALRDKPTYNVVAITRGDGEWVWEGDYKKAGFGADARRAASTQVLSHELGHTVYEESMWRHGDSSVASVLAKQGVKPTEANVHGVLALMHGAGKDWENSWQNTVINESFADAMSLIEVAKTGSKKNFDATLAVLESQREPATKAAMVNVAVHLASTPKPEDGMRSVSSGEADVHATLGAVLAAKAMGYEKLRALSRDEAPRVALNIAHTGFLYLVANHPAVFEELGGRGHGQYVKTMEAASKPLGPHGTAMKGRLDSHAEVQVSLNSKAAPGLESSVEEGVAPAAMKSLSDWRSKRVGAMADQGAAPPSPLRKRLDN